MDVEWVVLIEPEFIPMAARSKAWVCGRSFAGISGSNPAAGLDAVLLWVLCVVQWRTQEFCSGGGVQQIQLRTEDRENWDLGGGSPLVRGSGGSCNLVQEISFHVVKVS